MKTVFDKTTLQELINRVSTLNEKSTALWGKMNISQMLKHCTKFDEMVLHDTHYKQSLMGKIFGKIALKSILKDDAPMKKNMPTVPGFAIKGDYDVAAEKLKWMNLLPGYGRFNNPGFVHPFFGKIPEEKLGYLVYKHIDHHLRQFNA